MRDLASSMEYEKFKKDKDIINYGETGDKFYFIISGVCKVQVPNPRINAWQWGREKYQDLLDWQTDVFFPRV